MANSGQHGPSRTGLLIAGFAALLIMPSAILAGDVVPDWKQAYAPQNEDWRRTPQHLVFNNGAEPETLDPVIMTGVPEGRLAEMLFEGLVTLDPKTLAPRPGVAERWEVSPDGRRYTFHLRADACWSHGRPVTARDFRDAWLRVLAPATGAEYAYQLYYVVGAEDYNRKTTADAVGVGLRAPDERTFEVTLRAPCAYFLELCAFHTLLPVPMEIVAEHQERWTRPETIAGNGPFVLQAWKPRAEIVLAKNPRYWDRAFVKLERVTALPLDNLDTAYKMFLEGGLHWMTGVPLPKLEEIKRHPDYYVSPYLGTYYYLFNVTQPPFNDVRVRQAFCMALDRAVITEHVTRGGQRPATAFCPAMGAYEPPAGLAYDRDRARRLLTEAGYDAQSFPKIELLFNTSESHHQVAEAIAKQWETNLGLTVPLRNTEWKVYLALTKDRNFQVARAGWIGDYADPNTFLDLWVTGGGNNRTGWSNPEYDALIRAAQGELDPAKRLAHFRKAETILVEQVPIMPIYTYVNQGMLRESVLGWYENIRDWHPLKYIWLEE